MSDVVSLVVARSSSVGDSVDGRIAAARRRVRRGRTASESNQSFDRSALGDASGPHAPTRRGDRAEPGIWRVLRGTERVRRGGVRGAVAPVRQALPASGNGLESAGHDARDRERQPGAGGGVVWIVSRSLDREFIRQSLSRSSMKRRRGDEDFARLSRAVVHTRKLYIELMKQ